MAVRRKRDGARVENVGGSIDGTRRRGQGLARMRDDSVLAAGEIRTKRATHFRILRESSILLHPLPIRPRNPHI